MSALSRIDWVVCLACLAVVAWRLYHAPDPGRRRTRQPRLFSAHARIARWLRKELLGKLSVMVAKLQAEQVEVFEFGLVDDAESAYGVLPRLKAADLDLVFCNMLTYAIACQMGCPF